MRKSSTVRKKEKNPVMPYLMMLPAFVLFGIFTFYPFVKTVISTFSITDQVGRWLGWAGLMQWKLVLTDNRLKIILGNTFKYAAVCLVLTVTAAMFLALIGSKRGRGQRAVTTLYALPLAIAHSAASVIWMMVFLPAEAGGFLNVLLHTDIFWLNERSTAFICVSVVTVWTHIASCYIYLLAGFRNVPEELIEAATLDGANWFVRATRVMIPLASPQIFFVLFLTVTSSFKTFTQIRLLTGGGPMYSTINMTLEIYHRAVDNGLFASACCYSVMLFLIIFIVTRIQFIFEKKLVFYQ